MTKNHLIEKYDEYLRINDLLSLIWTIYDLLFQEKKEEEKILCLMSQFNSQLQNQNESRIKRDEKSEKMILTILIELS